MKQIPMTIQGAEKLQKELEYLKNTRRPNIIKALVEARKHGDLKENAEYFAAREQQSFCEGRIQKIEAMLFYAQLIDITKIPPSNIVIFGATVSVENKNTKEKSIFRIVGNDEANLKHNLISINSPLARGLIGKKEGNTTVIETPRGIVEYKIVKVQYI